jgi:hypothetical protein
MVDYKHEMGKDNGSRQAQTRTKTRTNTQTKRMGGRTQMKTNAKTRRRMERIASRLETKSSTRTRMVTGKTMRTRTMMGIMTARKREGMGRTTTTTMSRTTMNRIKDEKQVLLDSRETPLRLHHD